MTKPQILINDYGSKLTHYGLYEFTELGKQLLPTIEKYSGQQSRWIGQIMLDEGGHSSKPWECYVLLGERAPVHVLIHELIHSCSVSHYGQVAWFAHPWEEELTVHYLSQEVAALKKFPVVDSGYDSGVELIREFKAALGVSASDLEFASALIRQPLGERWDWLAQQIFDILGFDATLERYQELTNKLEALRQWTP